MTAAFAESRLRRWLVELDDQESIDAYQRLTDDELLEELSERLG